MIIAGMGLAALAAALHVYIFVLESIVWTGRTARRTFGMSRDAAQATKPLAFNQGFYNLFLSVETVLGIAFFLGGQETIGLTLLFVGTGSTVAAGLVLLLSDRRKARAALTQLTPGAFAIVALAIGVAA